MKIIAADKMDDCFNGDFMYKYTFDSFWTKDAIQALRALGQLRYYESFPRPMFQLSCPDGSVIKGVQGTCECRAIFARNDSKEAREQFESRFDEVLNSF